MAEWSIDPDIYFADIERQLVDDFRTIALDLDANVTQLTPVDTGRLRAAWFFSVDAPSFGEAPGDNGKGSLSGVTLSSEIILQNNVEYGPFVNDGTETIKPRHFVQGAISAVQG